jgi:hypothetical protein
MACSPACGCVRRVHPLFQVHGQALEGNVMDISMTMAITACLSAFGIGYAAGSVIRIGRKAIESID